MGKNGFFTAEQIASRYGLAASTVEDYVARGLLCPVNMEGEQCFHAGDFMRMEVIQKGRKLGFSLGELKLLIESAKQRRN